VTGAGGGNSDLSVKVLTCWTLFLEDVMGKTGICVAWSLLLSLAGHGAGVPGAEIVVDLQGGGDYTGIQPALDAAADGDEIVVRAGEYTIGEPLNFNRLHDPDDAGSPPMKNVVLRSEAG
jgi:hypothetical protein